MLTVKAYLFMMVEIDAVELVAATLGGAVELDTWTGLWATIGAHPDVSVSETVMRRHLAVSADLASGASGGGYEPGASSAFSCGFASGLLRVCVPDSEETALLRPCKFVDDESKGVDNFEGRLLAVSVCAPDLHRAPSALEFRRR